MSRMSFLFSTSMLAFITGCATANLGDKSVEEALKKLEPVPGRVSLYVCRADAFTGGGVGTEAFVNGRTVGRLKPGTFAHVEMAAGPLAVFLKRNGIGIHSGDSGTLNLDGKAGEVLFVWAGPAGAFIAPLTVDRFATRAEAEACVRSASYAVL